jgi:intein-encoded DNA endonuclease-like protein
MPIIRTIDHNFFKRWSSEMAYVLGYFAADGSMLKNGRCAYFIEFTSTDRVLLEHVQSVTGSNHRIASRERGNNCKTAYRIQIGSKQWFADLSKLGFTQGKSKTLQFPDLPKKYFSHFVRGYFDGDGCVHFQKYFAKSRNKEIWSFVSLFTSGSLCFLTSLHKLLKSFGLHGGHISRKSRGGYDLVFSRRDSLALYRLMYHTGEVTELFLPRKREKLEKAIQVLGLGTIRAGVAQFG